MRIKSLSVVFAVLIVTGCAAHAVTSGRVVVRDDRAAVELGFSDRDRVRIEEYYRAAKAKKAPPGLAKRERLPPGLTKRDSLPPGLQGHLPPHELESRLTVLPAVYVRVIIGRDIVLMQRETRMVMDILYGVIAD